MNPYPSQTDGYDSEYESTVDLVINQNTNECDFSKISCVETESDLEKPANAEFSKIIKKNWKSKKIPETKTQNKMVSFKSLLLSKVNNFRGGQLEKHVRQWKKLTNDPNILSIISGYNIEFGDAPRIQHKVRSPKFSDEEINLIKDEIDKLLTKVLKRKLVMRTYLFIFHKSNGGIRLIFNLKQLNKNIEYNHYKMDSINTVLNLITKDCFMTSIDLKDAYYSVKISENF